MLKLQFTIFLSLFFNPVSFAQSFSVLPKNIISNSSSSQLGNFSKSTDCDDTDPKYLKVIIKPTCYGANLRGGGQTIDPAGGPIEMVLNLSNSGDVFGSTVTFPVKSVWPENYGQTCEWFSVDGNESVNCVVDGVSVSYSCTYKNADWFLDDTLECSRIGDPRSEEGLNKNVSCLFLYSWSGKNSSAKRSYSKKDGYANCGLTEKDADYSGEMAVSTTKSVGRTYKFGKRGEVSVTYNNADIKKISVTQDMTTGEYKTEGKSSDVSVSFKQEGKKLTYKLEKGLDKFEQCLTIKPSFLGGNQFCGSYYSPLMLFFSEKRPLFVGRSSFPLREGASITNWIEKEAPGYFLALDRNGDGIINSSLELFGDNKSHSNGFENLKQFDKNYDYKIDSKDKVFSKLVLWKDKNGDGISQKEELNSLKSKSISSISVYYKKGTKSFGPRAEVREMGTFKFLSKGKEVVGEVLDIWFSPVN
ncbi:hypothetical protein [Halobacteriovorax sp.]|uniref:hypothetical protein n=1 Tax=Halobacteriovorax sp. TaxID=2020862 RepID=UPI00356B246B